MKIALYIEDGLEQIVLTPESDTEKGILGKLHDGSRQFELKRGSFYECRGGYARYAESWTSYTYGEAHHNDESTMIVLRAASALEARQGRDCAAGSIAEGDDIATGKAGDAQTEHLLNKDKTGSGK